MEKFILKRKVSTMSCSEMCCILHTPTWHKIRASIENEYAQNKRMEAVTCVGLQEVQYVDVGCGTFGIYSVRLVGKQSGLSRIIQKMVWEGTSMEVLGMKKTENIVTSCTTETAIKQFEDCAMLVLFEASSGTCPLDLVRIHNVRWNSEQDSETSPGFFFRVCTINIEAKPMYPTDKKETKPIYIEASVLRRKWFQIVDEQKAASLSLWRAEMSKARDTDHDLFCPVDLCSPQFLTEAWLVLEDLKYKEGTDLEFVELIKGKSSPCTGTNYFLTIQARKERVITTFQIVVLEVKPLKGWKLVTPLTPCKDLDEYDGLYDLWLPSIQIDCYTKGFEPKEETKVKESEGRTEVKKSEEGAEVKKSEGAEVKKSEEGAEVKKSVLVRAIPKRLMNFGR